MLGNRRNDIELCRLMREQDAWPPRTTTSRERRSPTRSGRTCQLLSVEELTERIALLTSEIERLQEAMSKKRASKDAANSFFKIVKSACPGRDAALFAASQTGPRMRARGPVHRLCERRESAALRPGTTRRPMADMANKA